METAMASSRRVVLTALVSTLIGVVVRLIMRIGEASPICSGAVMILQIVAVVTEFLIIVAAPAAMSWFVLRREMAQSTLLRGIALALPIQLVIYAVFTLLRHPCLL